jgi:DNA replication protein DnaC
VGATFSKLEGREEDLRRLKNWVDKPKNICLIMGSPGVGKTFICAALLDWLCLKVPSIRYWNERKFFERLRSYIGSNSNGDYNKELAYLADDYFLILDDLGSSAVNEWRREIWLELIDSRYVKELPTLITTNFTWNQVHSEMGERCFSRLKSSENVVIDLHGNEDMRQRPNGNK